MTEVPYSKCTLVSGDSRIRALIPSCFASKDNTILIEHKFYKVESVSPAKSSKTIDFDLLVKETENVNVTAYPVMGRVSGRPSNNFT